MSPVASYLIQTVLTLLGVVIVAALLVYGARRAGIGQPSGPLELLGRLPLDPRRAVYLVRVAERVYVLGASESGMERLGEIPRSELPDVMERPGGSFSDALARALRRPPSPPPTQSGGSQR